MQSQYQTRGSSRPQGFVYQVEFNAIATGKIVAMSKRRIRWRYGFPNQAAVDAGKSGLECRGEEHDVALVWSVSSGKRMIMSNGKQIFIGVNKSSVFEHQWTDSRGNMIKLVAHAGTPVANAVGSRQYDLFINGKSYFTLPKTYEIGLRGPAQETRTPGVITAQDHAVVAPPKRHLPSYSPSGRTILQPRSQEEEMSDIKRAIEASLQESRDHLAAKGRLGEESAPPSVVQTSQAPQNTQPPQTEAPLIDFLSDPTPSVTSAPYVQNPNALVLLNATPQQYQVDPFANNVGSTSTAPTIDEFAPKAPSYNDISDQILLNYSPHNNVIPAAPVMQQQQYPPQYPPQTQVVVPVAAANPFDDEHSQNYASALSSQVSVGNSYQASTNSYNVPPTHQYQQQGHGYNNQM